jgi:hypothetical protein
MSMWLAFSGLPLKASRFRILAKSELSHDLFVTHGLHYLETLPCTFDSASTAQFI